MLDLRLIRDDTEGVAARLRTRVDDVDLDRIVALDAERRRLETRISELNAERNTLSKQFGAAARAGGDVEGLRRRSTEIGDEVAAAEERARAVAADLHDRLLELPNLPDDRAPVGGKEANRVVATWGGVPDLGPAPRDHVEMATALGLIDFERGAKLGGSGYWIYRGAGAVLEWALLDFFVRSHLADGYEFVLPPHVLLDECGYASGQFPKFYDDVYRLRSEGDERSSFLLPTAETALINVFRDEVLSEGELPRKMFAYTPCYRREAGSHRANERGTIRGHQFNKVELFQFTTPDQGPAALDEMVAKVRRLVEELGLHHQVSLLSTRDASASMRLTYDVEVWLPSIGEYKEVSSASWAGDYQARRAAIRYRPERQKGTAFVHTLNASGLATSRLLPAILEQCQQPDGSLRVPEPLQAFLHTDVLRPA
ncbi:MAG TPA: serine--tRNA ligase [Acidimicrobiales bacterium]|nr:serine--tRNA ligase [Acidimicrobiales bacterium]